MDVLGHGEEVWRVLEHVDVLHRMQARVYVSWGCVEAVEWGSGASSRMSGLCRWYEV